MEQRLNGFVCEVPVDSSWSVSTYDADGPVMTLYDDSTESAVTLRGDALVGLLETALPELVDLQVSAKVAELERLRAQIAADVEAIVPERLATPDEMEPGGWVRFEGEKRWRHITAIRAEEEPHSHQMARRIFADGDADWWVLPHTTLPYRTAAEMQAEAPIPSDEGEYRAELRAMARAQGTDVNGTPLNPDAA